MYELDGVLEPGVIEFVERNIRSLLTWDIVVFFHRNPGAALDCDGLATRLGRRSEEIETEVQSLCEGHVLQSSGGLIRYKPTPDMWDAVAGFVESCQDRDRRLALIALVLHKLGPHEV